MNMNKLLLVILLWMLALNHLKAQQALSLDTCYAKARLNYPLLRQMDLIAKSADYSMDNAAKAYYPQLSINGQATYQSDVTKIPISLPNMSIPVISKDQYKLYADLNQTLYDGGAVKLQKEAIQANAIIEKQNIEVELYKLRERIHQIFFSILMVNRQLEQSEILKKDLQAASDKTRAAVTNGIALKSSEDVLKAEMLKVDQHMIELRSTRTAYLNMLSLFIGQTLDNNTVLETPSAPAWSNTINRPELLYYNYRNQLLDIQRQQVQMRNRPKLSLFVQGGYGRPALNLLNNEFDLYYIGGLRLNWSLSGLYTARNEKAVLGMNYQLLEAQKETFLFNTNILMRQQDEDIHRLEELLKTDDEIIALREKIRLSAQAQLENGVITASDYLREMNAEDQAKQNRLLHELQLLMAQYKQQNTIGNSK
jgi:outer membrane protein TolC